MFAPLPCGKSQLDRWGSLDWHLLFSRHKPDKPQQQPTPPLSLGCPAYRNAHPAPFLLPAFPPEMLAKPSWCRTNLPMVAAAVLGQHSCLHWPTNSCAGTHVLYVHNHCRANASGLRQSKRGLGLFCLCSICQTMVHGPDPAQQKSPPGHEQCWPLCCTAVYLAS